MTAKLKQQPKVGRPPKGKFTETDLRAWQDGKVQLSELATRAGISVAAVSKAMKKLRIATPAKGISEFSPGPSTPTSAAPVPAGDQMLVQPIWRQGTEGFTETDVMTLARSAAYGALLQAHRVLASQQEIGPTALKMYFGVAQQSVEQLDRLGVISLAKTEQEQLPKLTVQVMTEEEEEALRSGDHLREEDEKLTEAA